MHKFLSFSAYEWGNLGRRKVRLAYEFARRPKVASLLYVEPPVHSSLLDLARGRFFPSHLGQSRRAHLRALLGRPRRVEGKVWVYSGSRKSLPLTRLRGLRQMAGLESINRNLYTQRIRRLLNSLPGDELVLWLTHPLQAWALDAFPQRVLACYDWTDDWAAFEALPVDDPQVLVALNERILREADLVFAVSEELTRRATILNAHTRRAPNATDPQFLESASAEGPVARKLEGLPRPVIGYIGQIADNVDFDLIRILSEARPDWSFVFVGPVWHTKQAHVDNLSAHRNVRFLGRRPHAELPAFLRGFDVCILPHRVSPLTHSMDPTKLYDYLASGKPIVSTPVAGVDRFPDVVYVGASPGEFNACLDEALHEGGHLKARRLSYARENTWPRRAAEIWDLLKAEVGS